jgi:DNA polymerase elongation subunit (family B)
VRKLFLDIETSPHVAYVWRLFDENISVEQLIEPTRMICVAWTDEEHIGQDTIFAAEWQRGGHERMVRRVHGAVQNADAIIHYNGASFDEPHLAREFLQYGLEPPQWPQTIDLYKTISKRFRFASGKLAHVADALKIREGKIKTDFTLWKRVLSGEKAAEQEMEAYNREDVELMVDLYNQLLPWIDRHPNAALYEDDERMRCTRCSSENLLKQGFRRTSAGTFQQYQCRDCNSWSRGSKRVTTTPLRESR